MANDPLNQAEIEELVALQKFINTDSPGINEKHTVHSFLNNVATSLDTTKTGFLDKDELGMPKLPVRTNKELAVFCNEIADMPYFADYFNKMSEVTTATSLSRDGKLINLAVVTRREVGDVTKKPREKRGFFKKREEPEGGDV